MARKLILFGPPAIGKSTLIDATREAAERGSVACIDLEDVATLSGRQEFLALLAKVAFRIPLLTTAADIGFETIPEELEIIFLFTNDEAAYLRMVEGRAKEVPAKAGQDEERVYEGMKEFVGNPRIIATLDTAKYGVDFCASRLVELLNEGSA